MQLKMSGVLPGFVKYLFFEPNFQYCQSTTQNFWILPNIIVGMSPSGQNSQFWAWFLLRLKISEFYQTFIFRMSWMVKNVSLELKFLTRIKICQYFAKFKPSQVQGWSKLLILSPNLQRELKISGLCQIPSIRRSGVVKNLIFWARFSTCNWKFLAFCQISSLCNVQIGQKLSI